MPIIQRYRLTYGLYTGRELVEDPNGEFVRFNDVEKLLAAKVVAQSTVTLPPQCSVCKGNDAACSLNYSGGWVGDLCPNRP